MAQRSSPFGKDLHRWEKGLQENVVSGWTREGWDPPSAKDREGTTHKEDGDHQKMY